MSYIVAMLLIQANKTRYTAGTTY